MLKPSTTTAIAVIHCCGAFLAMAKQINSPKIGTIVKHTGWRFEDDKNYPCDVLITDGQYMSNGRLSNFWYWKRVLPDGTLSETEHGYGSFEMSDKNYETEIRVKCVV